MDRTVRPGDDVDAVIAEVQAAGGGTVHLERGVYPPTPTSPNAFVYGGTLTLEGESGMDALVFANCVVMVPEAGLHLIGTS